MEGGDVPEVPLADGGFSVLVDVAKNGARHRILFDAGTTPDGVVENMRRLEVDPSGIETIICSHGHFDHTAGLDGLIRRLGRVNLPVLIHPHFWRQRRLSIPGRDPQEIPTTSRRALVDAGFEVIEERQPSFLFNRSVLVTGEVPRTTSYEAGFPLQEAWLDGRWQPDALVLDDQALIVDIKDKGLLVITGCGHAGIVNICRYARRLTKERALYAIIGGFHLNGPIFEPLIPESSTTLAPLPPVSWSRPTAPDGGPSTLWVLALARRSSRAPSVRASNSDRTPPPMATRTTKRADKANRSGSPPGRL
jgi:7,8-dihydropterin-6-yl-methyl-4-(beta-D-ribofuranosyl)aminobenzene 5'-phosphate synthase